MRAKVIVLAASACETARLLLNSRSVRRSQGRGELHGTVGKYITDSTGTCSSAYYPQLILGSRPTTTAAAACT